MAYPRLFPIFYSSVFTLLNIALLGLLLITPANAIDQALSSNHLYYVFIIAGCYLLTLILSIIIYASRLYTNRTVLSGIPKTWIPIEKGDVGENVRKMIVESLSRSAVIAWNARPRVHDHGANIGSESENQGNNAKISEKIGKASRVRKLFRRHPRVSDRDERDILMPPHPAAWNDISHEGWSSPTSADLPNLQYVTVILELPHLIEAKAVSSAPPDPSSTTSTRVPDARALEILQRPAAMGLRDYIGHLTSLGILSSTTPVTDFLSSYESARFSPKQCTESQFRELMKLFADILRGMNPVDPAILESLNEEGAEESDIDNDASSTTTSEAPSQTRRSHSITSMRTVSSRSGSEGTIRTAPSRRRAAHGAIAPRNSEPGNGDGNLLNAAPTTPQGRKRGRLVENIERSPSLHSFAQTRRPYAISQASSGSLRSASSVSVIRLKLSEEPGDLPYTLRLTSSSPIG